MIDETPPEEEKPRRPRRSRCKPPSKWADKPYDVGKGKPPKTRQFVEGQSGNPSGKKKTRKPHPGNQINGITHAMFAELNYLLSAAGPLEEITGRYQLARIFIRKMFEDAVKGDRWARREIWNFYLASRTDSDAFKTKDASEAGAEMLSAMSRIMMDPTLDEDTAMKLINDAVEARERFEDPDETY